MMMMMTFLKTAKWEYTEHHKPHGKSITTVQKDRLLKNSLQKISKNRLLANASMRESVCNGKHMVRGVQNVKILSWTYQKRVKAYVILNAYKLLFVHTRYKPCKSIIIKTIVIYESGFDILWIEFRKSDSHCCFTWDDVCEIPLIHISSLICRDRLLFYFFDSNAIRVFGR